MDQAQKAPAGGGERLWWGAIVWRARAAFLVFALAAAALTLPAQVQDMLANLADGDDMSWESWSHALGFHAVMIAMAIGLWYWARAVLLAWFKLPDTPQARAALTDNPGAQFRSSRPEELALAGRAFAFVPRALGLGAALVAAIATLRSDKYIQTAIVIGWGAGLYYLLKYRLLLEARFGLGQTREAAARAPGRWWITRAWRRMLELLDYAPLGRWVAAGSLALASGLFALSGLTAFWTGSIVLKTELAHYLPGPSGFLFLLGMCVAPLTALTYAVDRATHVVRLGGLALPLRRVPTLVILLALMGMGATIMNLHALRVADPDAMTPDQRAPLATLFRAWVAKCAPGNGPVQPIIVAVSGGASRAGLWAARVLDVVDDSVRKSGSKSASIFAVSSVSGGSLGAAAYLSMRAGLSGHLGKEGCVLPSVTDDRRDVAVTEAMRADNIGPALAGTLLGDAPRALAAYPAWLAQKLWHGMGNDTDQIAYLRGNDRAEALERSFEYNWHANGIVEIADIQRAPVEFNQPYLSLFYDKGQPRGDVPLWISNGTDANSGNRLLTLPFAVNGESFCRGAQGGGAWYGADPAADKKTRLDALLKCKPAASYFWYAMGPFAAAKDVLSLLRADLPISTAIDNTSRFPFLSPSGEITPTKDPHPTPGEAYHDAQIIDGGYFENEGVMSAMDLARWLRTYGPALLGGRQVYPIIVQATSDADRGKTERDIPRCGNGLPLNPGVADSPTRGSQFLVPLSGLTAVRSGHSRVLLQQAVEDFCDEGGQQAFFHFYLYDSPDFEVPLNWSLSERVADYIWTDAIAVCGNDAERKNLIATLRVKPGDWKLWRDRADRASRDIYTCTGAPVKVTMPLLPRLDSRGDPE